MVKKGGIKIMVKAPVKAPDDKKERVRLTINNAFGRPAAASVRWPRCAASASARS